jgi:hypothetical protein
MHNSQCKQVQGHVGIRVVLLVAVLTMLSRMPLSAQAGKSAFEVGFDVGPFLLFNFGSSGSSEVLGVLGGFVEPHVDYFLKDDLDVGVSSFFYHVLDSESSLPPLSFGGVYAHANYHFNPGSDLSPYVGARIGMLASQGTEETFLGFGAQVGLQYFVAPPLSINAQLVVSVFPATQGVYALSSLGFGLSYYFQ